MCILSQEEKRQAEGIWVFPAAFHTLREIQACGCHRSQRNLRPSCSNQAEAAASRTRSSSRERLGACFMNTCQTRSSLSVRSSKHCPTSVFEVLLDLRQHSHGSSFQRPRTRAAWSALLLLPPKSGRRAEKGGGAGTGSKPMTRTRSRENGSTGPHQNPSQPLAI